MRKLNKNSPRPHRCAAEDRAGVEITTPIAKRVPIGLLHQIEVNLAVELLAAVLLNEPFEQYYQQCFADRYDNAVNSIEICDRRPLRTKPRLSRPPVPRVSAGLLMYRIRDGKLQVLLVHPGGPFFKNKDEGAWTIPKGEVEPGEDLLAAAHPQLPPTRVNPVSYSLGIPEQRDPHHRPGWDQPTSGACSR
jgi:NUDIX domain